MQEILTSYKGASDQYACAVVTSANSGKVYRSHSGVTECVAKPAVILHKLHDPCSMMYDLLVTHNTAQLKLEDILENKVDKEELEYSDDEVESDISSAILNLLKTETLRLFRPRLISSVSIRVRSSAEIAAERERRTTTNVSMIRVGALAIRRRVVIDVDDDDDDDDGELKLNNRVKVVRAKPQRRIDEDRNADTFSSVNRSSEVACVDDIDREGVSQVDKGQARSPYKIVKTCKFVKKA